MKTFVGLTIMLVLVSGSACATAGNVQSTQQLKPIQQEELAQGMEERFRKLGRELDELLAKIGPFTEQAKKKAQRYRGEAEKKRQEAAARLERLRKASEKKWRKFSEEMNEVMAELEKAFEASNSDSDQL